MFFLVEDLRNNFVEIWSQALGKKETSQGHYGFNLTCLDRRFSWVHNAERWCCDPLWSGDAGPQG